MAEIKIKTAGGGQLNEPKEPNKLKELLASFLFYLSILFFFIGFQFSDTMLGNWYQQFMPNINGASIKDITFTDSLNGFAVTSIGGSNSYILKTTNGGDNWIIKFLHTQPFVRVEFINSNTGFTNAYTTIFKTNNAGENWTTINLPGIFGDDMFVLSQDTIWLAMSESLTGGVFRTTDGGTSWEPQAAFGNNNPSHIYMYNARIGFIDAGGLRKTTDGGASWTPPIAGAGNFLDMYFVDSSTGWKCNLDMKKTTDGGFNWVTQTLPSGGNIVLNGMLKFSNVNIDTIWGVGGVSSVSGGSGMVFRTTSGGDNWLFQVPDTNFNIFRYFHNKFVNKSIGWAYAPLKGVHTTTGGDPIFYTGIVQTPNAVPEKFILKQNYPNPFNPRTVIPYSLSSPAYVKIIAYDIIGREVQKMVDQYQQAGAYEVDFMGKFTATGVYFYRMTVTVNKSNHVYTDTRKMILLK